jgi:7,8-dihydropterin-6-yl-methyl-4-(beta-D-ribofuranosyl)aminobenzene 5'-phosphate synthase
MRITLLAEDTAPGGGAIEREHGFSALVESGGKRLLFDTGQTDMFIRNAKRRGLDLAGTDFVVVSHGHYDHTGGLPDLLKSFDAKPMTFVGHPGIFEKKLHGSREYIGCPLGRNDIEAAFGKCIFTEKAVEFSPGVTFLGEVPRCYEDPGTCADHMEDGTLSPDPVKDDSALLFETDRGMVLLTGCSHSGILNLAGEAVTHGKLYAVIGGLHLIKAGEMRMNAVISGLGAMGIIMLRPCHCTGEQAIERMERELGAQRVTAGEIIEL